MDLENVLISAPSHAVPSIARRNCGACELDHMRLEGACEFGGGGRGIRSTLLNDLRVAMSGIKQMSRATRAAAPHRPWPAAFAAAPTRRDPIPMIARASA